MAEDLTKTKRRRTRLAPSPTGALHLGNARTFLVNWAIARQAGWEIVLRIEDLDGPRVKAGAAEGCIATLEWLGIDWDVGPIVQSHDLRPYEAAMEVLAGAGRVYPSGLSRGDIEAAASAPQEGSHETRFGPELRPVVMPRRFEGGAENWRFVTPDETVSFEDVLAGPQAIRPLETIGDFVVWTKRGTPAYQLAVVVDDERQGVTDIVRGDDLLDSAARQVLLMRALGYAGEPSYCHVPLVYGSDGRRLAKRHGDTRVETYRGMGVPREAVIGLIGWWCGVMKERGKLSGAEFAARFAIDTMPRTPITFTQQDHAWLLAQAR